MDWRDELQLSISTIEKLRDYIGLSRQQENQLRRVIEKHPMRVTRYYASLMNWSDPSDPLVRMAVPSTEEMDVSGSYDTSGELQSTKMPGLQHKYRQTALILATSRCPVYCRYCFRKRLVGLETEEVLRRFADAAQYIGQHKEIKNVLISGGDPLILSTAVIEKFLRRLSVIPHLDFIRIGSRTPITFPDRILKDRSLLEVLGRYGSVKRRLYVVTQYNHPAEVTEASAAAIDKLVRVGIVIMNQTVLLRGVNDDPDTLAVLMSELIRVGVSPYYLFQCRPVKRVKRRFQIPLERGYRIVEKAKSMLDGPSKRFRYVMSHRTGKIEVVGIMDDEIYLRYHQARDPRNIGRLFKRRLVPGAGWLDDLK